MHLASGYFGRSVKYYVGSFCSPLFPGRLISAYVLLYSSPVFLKVHLASKYFGRCIRLYIALYSSPLFPGRCISIYMLLYSNPVFLRLHLASKYFGRCIRHYAVLYSSRYILAAVLAYTCCYTAAQYSTSCFWLLNTLAAVSSIIIGLYSSPLFPDP